MAQAVTNAFNEDGWLMVEAGTGTGKSMAYLAPAARFALQRGERVGHSTDTKALQDQLILKDVPDLTPHWSRKVAPGVHCGCSQGAIQLSLPTPMVSA